MYRSPYIFRVIKSRRLRWAVHVARMQEGNIFKILTGKPTGKGDLADLGADGLKILEWIFKKRCQYEELD